MSKASEATKDADAKGKAKFAKAKVFSLTPAPDAPDDADDVEAPPAPTE